MQVPEKCILLGEELSIDFVPSRRAKQFRLKEGAIFVSYPEKELQRTFDCDLHYFFKIKLKDALIPMLAKWDKALGVKHSGFTVKDMTSRWGSCNWRTRHLNFSSLLCPKPLRLVDYIALHETAHLLERLHNEHFRAILSSQMPDWKARENELNGR